MRAGDIALATNDSAWYGWWIRVGTRSRYSHVRMIIDEDGTTIEATNGGTRYGKVDPADVVIEAPLSDYQRMQIKAIAPTFIGTPYGWVDVLVLSLAQVGIRLPGLSKEIERPDRLFCSQLADYMWHLVGYLAFADRRQPQNVVPGDFADWGLRQGSILATTNRKTSTRGPVAFLHWAA